MSDDATAPCIRIGETVVERHTEADIVRLVQDASSRPSDLPIAIGSVNLDHLHHFSGGRESLACASVKWILLADGAPIARIGRRLSGAEWPRVTGADLLEPLIRMCEREHRSIGFLGGTAQMHTDLREVVATRFPELRVAGYWSPDRRQIEDPRQSAELAADIAASGAHVLVVGLGKPRQEYWIRDFGRATGCSVLLAFGASADFLAGRVERAPELVRKWGMEWLFRLAQEPRRLARRYLIQGPPALMQLRKARLERSSVRPTSSDTRAQRP